MDIFDLLMLLGGLGFFLFGMHVLSEGLEKTAGGKMQSILQKITGNRVKGLAVGAAVTAVIQSSSAVTVMLVGLVNAGIMSLTQAISVTMGSNIGTTMTAWILSLSGISSDNIFIALLKPVNFSTIVAFIGAFLLLFSKKDRNKNIGMICVGFAVLMFGMDMMSGAVKPLANMPQFVSILTAFRNPVLGVLAGALFTAAIQSSSASVGVLQALSLTGAVTFSSAIPIIMGQNIGTCISAMMAVPGTNKNAKRVAIVHVLFNSIGSVVWLIIWSIANGIFKFGFANSAIEPAGIAVVHSVFNIATTIMLFPAAHLLEKLSRAIIKGEDSVALPVIALDERLLTVPAVAVAHAYDTTKDMAAEAEQTVTMATALLFDGYDTAAAQTVLNKEKVLDSYEDALGTYLVKLSRCNLNDEEALTNSMLLHTISDFERIGDHAKNIVATAEELATKNIGFSAVATTELQVITAAVTQILHNAVAAFTENNLAAAMEIEPLEEVIDNLIDSARARHIVRLQEGNCTIELGFVFTDFLTDCERISDHCSNIGVALLETAHGTFDTHERLREIKNKNSEGYRTAYERYSKEFAF